MKKLVSLAFSLLLMTLCILPAAADILWEPYENDYYMNRGYENFTGIARNYYVPDGMTVNLYESPKGGKLIKTLEAGARVYVGFSETIDGEVWGVGYPLDDWETEGWFRLGRLQLEYDHSAFMEEFSDQIEATSGSINATLLTDPVPTWTYPGSGVIDITLDCNWKEVQFNDGKLEYRQLYTDPEGGQWGYVGYFMGHCGWIYLDDLHDETPPAFPQESENTVTDTRPTEDNPNSDYREPEYGQDAEFTDVNYDLDRRNLGWVVILVVTIMAVTALAIFAIKHRK